MSELLKLADRCEAATGPDQELNAAIFAALNPDWFPHKTDKSLFVNSEKLRETKYQSRNTRFVKQFTASLDAAMSLVPEGWVIGSVAEEVPRTQWVVELRHGCRTSYDKVVFSEYEPWRRCATLALALCAAALRAREAQS